MIKSITAKLVYILYYIILYYINLLRRFQESRTIFVCRGTRYQLETIINRLETIEDKSLEFDYGFKKEKY